VVSWLQVFDGLAPGGFIHQQSQAGETSQHSFGDCYEAMRGVRAGAVSVLQLLARLQVDPEA
jgi:hypothetical protein